MRTPATIPRSALIGAMALVGASLIAASAGRIFGPLPTAPAPVKAIVARDLRFADQPDGGVAVTDATSGAWIETVQPGTNGFLRALVRGLARQRKLDNEGTAIPFRLTAWTDGRITLDDSTTSQRVDLEAFGPTNAAVFARLLQEGGKTR